ncbi:hypothetical protein ES708_27658 [subsurface metagenome]
MREQLRLLFRKVYWKALDHKKKHEEIQRYVQLRKERREIPEETEEEREEREQYELWVKGIL